LDALRDRQGTTVVEGFRSKEKCQSAGEQWRNSLPNSGVGNFTGLEPKP
jgi:hypothetical protein